ncbi:hypothetical protein BC828DRAFT_371787 [Blastocladiella britannica]|nr:hypothetical protein BC828DRAFT_371787 [Blastocladiella britannica]
MANPRSPSPRAASNGNGSTHATSTNTPPIRVAVVGSGIAGLSAAWALNQYPDRYRVTLYESGDYLGGHTHTVEVPPLKEYAANPNVHTVPVDTGFIVMNPVTYPNFMRFLDQLRVPLAMSDMSFAVSRDKGAFEWAGDTLFTLFAQAKNLIDLSGDGMWVMLWDVLRFHWMATDIADAADMVTFNADRASAAHKVLHDQFKDMSIGEFLDAGSYSRSFRDNFLTPQTAAIWSTPAGTCLQEFPIMTLIKFFRNHRMLQLVGRPKWLTIALGAREYVDRIAPALPDVRISTPVKSVTRNYPVQGASPSRSAAPTLKRGAVTVTDTQDQSAVFDHVILATHGDTSAALVADLTPRERQVLEKVRYTPNRAVLHRDAALMPRVRATWSSWNYITRSGEAEGEDAAVCVTYWMNRLQPFIPRDTHGDVFLTINPLYEPDRSLVIDEYEYDHPVYDFGLVEAQEGIPRIANMDGIGYAGAWLNYCFHEDGCTAGLAAAAALGASPPFELTLNGGYPTHRRAFTPMTGAPLAPTADAYLQRMARVLPNEYIAGDATARKAATAARSRPPPHAIGMSATRAVLEIAKAAAARALPTTVAQCLGGRPRTTVSRMIQSRSGATAPVRALDAREAMGLAAPVRVLELLERVFVAYVMLVLGVPLVAGLYVLGKVDLVSGLSGAGGRDELLWVSPRLRVVWKPVAANKVKRS